MWTLHVAPLMAAWVDTVQQNPVVVKLQSDPEPPWKLLLPAIVQTVISLLSVGAGVGIAVWSFRKNKESEQKQWDRNQQAACEQWLRDQRKAEWRELIETANACERLIEACRRVRKDKSTLELSKRLNKLALKRRYVRQRMGDRLFISEEISSVRQDWTKAEKELRDARQKLRHSTDKDTSLTFTVLGKIGKLIRHIREIAREDIRKQIER